MGRQRVDARHQEKDLTLEPKASATLVPHISRRRLLQAAGATAAGLFVARAALASTQPAAGPIPVTADAIGQDAIDALADSLDFDVTKIFRHVADEVWYEPYAGSLRGASGTLQSRAGNSVDKAALLAALLRSAQYETRFASGTIDDASASALLGATAITRDAVRARARSVLTGVPEGAVGPSPSSAGLPAELQTIPDRREELVAEARAWATDRLATDVTTIVQALANAGISIPEPVVALPQLERARHTWVQVRQGSEWVDLDPLVPGMELGVAAATPEGEPFDTIPDDLRHQVRFTVTADVISGDALAQQALLDQSFPTDTLDAASMILFHEKPDDLKGIGLAIGSALGGGGTQYQAILQTTDQTYVGDSWLSLAGGDPGPFGGDGPRDGAAVAEWLDITVTSPDGTTRTTRRPIFDLVGADVRAAGAVDVAAVPDPQLVSLGTDLTDEFQPLRDLWFLSVATGATDVDGLATHAGTTLDEVASTGLAASLYHVARDGINAELALDRGVRSFLEAPNVTAYVIGGRVQDDGTFDVASRVDLLHRAFGQLPVADLPASAPAGIVAGVLSHVAERIQSGEGLPDLGTDPTSARPPVSAGAVLEAARDQAIELLVLRGDPPAGLAWPAAAAALLKGALADGWVAIAPATPVMVDGLPRLGWWLVDPATGATLDMLDDGGGAVLGEDIVSSLKKVALWARPYICLGIGLAELAHMAHDLMSGDLVGAGVGAAVGAGAHKLVGCH